MPAWPDKGTAAEAKAEAAFLAMLPAGATELMEGIFVGEVNPETTQAEAATPPEPTSTSTSVDLIDCNVKPVAKVMLDCGAVLVLSQGSVVDFVGDAIVNAANQGCLGGKFKHNIFATPTL